MTKVLAISEYYNEAENIPGFIENIASQTHVPDLMIIIDDGSTDNSTEIIVNYLRQHQIPYLLYQMPPKAKPNANLKGRAFQNVDILNNDWVESEEYDYLILIAADTRLPIAYIEFGIKLMNRIPAIGVIGGRIVGEPGTNTPIGTGKLVRWDIVKKTSGRYWDLDPDSLWNIIALKMNSRLLIVEDMLMDVTRPTHMFGPHGFYHYGARMYYLGWNLVHAILYSALLAFRNTHPVQFLKGYIREFAKRNWRCEDSEIRQFYGFKRMILRMISGVPMDDRATIVKLGIDLSEELNLDDKFMNKTADVIKDKINLKEGKVNSV